MTAIQAIRKEMIRIQRQMAECIVESGYVLSSFREEYLDLVHELKKYNDALKYMEDLYGHGKPSQQTFKPIQNQTFGSIRSGLN